MSRHSTLGDVPDTLALRFLGFVNDLVLVQEFSQIYLVLPILTLRSDKSFIFIVEIRRRRGLGANRQDLGLLLSLQEG